MQAYTHEQLSSNLIRITDFTGVCCYLVIGSQKACLLDTCNGLGNIRSYVESLTDKPIFVILTHGHLDHMGGAALFEEVYMHPADIPVLQNHADMTFRVNDTNGMLHPEVPLTAQDFVPAKLTGILPLREGQQFDLGGITIEMLGVPGHTPGMMCPLLVEDRTIIFGDACGVAVLLFDEFSSTVSQYKESLKKLKQQEYRYDTVYRNHGSFWSPKELLDNVMECCDCVLTGTDDRDPVTIHGYCLFAAKKVAADGHGREDKKEGNLFYSSAKVQ